MLWLLSGCKEGHSRYAAVDFLSSPGADKNCICKGLSRIHTLPQAASTKPALALGNASCSYWQVWPSLCLTVSFLLGSSHSQPMKPTKNPKQKTTQPNNNKRAQQQTCLIATLRSLLNSTRSTGPQSPRKFSLAYEKPMSGGPISP